MVQQFDGTAGHIWCSPLVSAYRHSCNSWQLLVLTWQQAGYIFSYYSVQCHSAFSVVLVPAKVAFIVFLIMQSVFVLRVWLIYCMWPGKIPLCRSYIFLLCYILWCPVSYTGQEDLYRIFLSAHFLGFGIASVSSIHGDDHAPKILNMISYSYRPPSF